MIKTRSGYCNASEEFYRDFISTLSKLIMEQLRLGHSTCCACNPESVVLSRETYTSLLYWLASCMRSFNSFMSSSVSVLSVVRTVICSFRPQLRIASVNNVLGRCLWPFAWHMLTAHWHVLWISSSNTSHIHNILRYSELIHCFKRRDYRCVCLINSVGWLVQSDDLPALRYSQVFSI